MALDYSAMNTRKLMHRIGALLASLALIGLSTLSANATPVQQKLARSSSSVTFGINSPNPSLRMNGSFRDFSGALSLDPTEITNSDLSVSLTLSSAQLPPDQILQAVLLQSVIARVANRASTFESSSIEHLEGSRYLVNGTYTWMNKRKPASVPIEVERATPSLTEIRLLLDGSFRNKNIPGEFAPLAQSAEGSKGWTKALLVFTPSGRS